MSRYILLLYRMMSPASYLPKITWQKVNAVGIEKIAYDLSHKCLYVLFRTNKKLYVYLDVEEEVYEKLMAQEHKTTFLNREIKGNYEFEEIILKS